MNIDEMERQLNSLGVTTTRLGNGFLAFQFKIPHGRFRNKTVEIALQVPPTFPDIPPSGPYIKPHLLPNTGGGGTHPFGGIHERSEPTTEFQYWSRPCNGWDQTDKDMKVYLAFLRTLFDFE